VIDKFEKSTSLRTLPNLISEERSKNGPISVASCHLLAPTILWETRAFGTLGTLRMGIIGYSSFFKGVQL